MTVSPESFNHIRPREKWVLSVKQAVMLLQNIFHLILLSFCHFLDCQLMTSGKLQVLGIDYPSFNKCLGFFCTSAGIIFILQPAVGKTGFEPATPTSRT
jgi:hypothetical protein